jgi:hypothetical protein
LWGGLLLGKSLKGLTGNIEVIDVVSFTLSTVIACDSQASVSSLLGVLECETADEKKAAKIPAPYVH